MVESSFRPELQFQLCEKLTRREPVDPQQTNSIIDDIVKMNSRYCGLKELHSETFIHVMTVDFVYNLNVGEQVGSQTREETEEIMTTTWDHSNEFESNWNQKGYEKETLNTMKAIKEFQCIFTEEMKGEGLLTVQQVCDVHRILMKGLHPNAGVIRKTEARTLWNGKVHFYIPPEKIEDRFYALIDSHNANISNVPENSKDRVEYIIKCAARLLFEFVDTHPFGDGNGRMCRLLANYVLSLIAPFPVGFNHTSTTEGVTRKDYINAIVRCRDNPAEGPCDIATMLVEGVWYGWKSLFKNLESHTLN